MVLHQHGHGHSHGGGHGHSHGGHSHSHGARKLKDDNKVASDEKSKEEEAKNEEEGLLDGTQRRRKKRSKIDFRNINVRAAFIHTIGDLVQSIGVIVAGYIIWFKVSDVSSTFSFC